MLTNTLPAISLSATVGKEPGVLVVGLAETSEGELLVGLPDELAKAFSKALGSDVTTIAKQLGASAKTGKTVLLAGAGGLKLVVVGIGPIDVTPEQVRRAAGQLGSNEVHVQRHAGGQALQHHADGRTVGLTKDNMSHAGTSHTPPRAA